jgi:hypothetical protein
MAAPPGYVRSETFEEWVATATLAAERAKSKDDTEDRLVAEIRTQQSTVQKIADTLLAVGVSETLRAMLVKEEDKLRDLRRRAADAAAPKAPRTAIEPARVGAALSEVERLADRDPGSARDRLARYLAPVVLRPVMDQARFRLRKLLILLNATFALRGVRPKATRASR